MKKTGRCKKYIFYTKKGRKKAVFIDLFYHLLYNAAVKIFFRKENIGDESKKNYGSTCNSNNADRNC